MGGVPRGRGSASFPSNIQVRKLGVIVSLRTQFLLAAAACTWTSTARAQANANAVTTAKDAFGFKTGDDSVGIYNEESVRGFNLEAAGNYRVEGTYFVKNSGVSAFFLQSSTVRIGYNTLGTTLPGPSGVVDYQLRDPKRGEPDLWTVGLDVYQQPFAELHLKHRTAKDDASYSIGVGRVFDFRDFQGGSGGKSIILAGTGRINVGDLQIRAFGGEYHYKRPGLSRIVPQSDRLPGRIARGHYLGQEWSMERGERRIAGVLLDQQLGRDAGFGGTVVFSQEDPSRGYLQLLRIVNSSDLARATMIAVPHQRSTAWSGEIRAHLESVTGNVQHRIDLALRGRHQWARFGGSQSLDLGQVQLGERPDMHDEPDLDGSSATRRDSVDQWGAAMTYRAAIGNRLQLNTGIMATNYEKSFREAVTETRTTAKPFLYNAGVAWQVSDRLELYASQSRGLEEAGVAPASASNRNEILNAILVTQRELGLRHRWGGSWTTVVAAFDTQKPYAGIEASTAKYTILGDVRHRGIEASVAGQPLKGFSVLLGGVAIDPAIRGSAVRAGTLGERPVGVPKLRAIANVDYANVGLDGLSVDAGVTVVSSRPAQSRINAEREQLMVPGTLTLNAGARYRFKVGRQEITVRGQVQNLLNDYSWEVNSSETLVYSAPRRFRLVVTGSF
jgi:iron complex outermembrane receptor protein